MEFKLKSKLSAIKYPCLQTMEEILKWLTFENNVDPYEIDPVFLGRLGAMAKDENRKHRIISGYRPTALQEKLYLAKGGIKNSDGTYSDPYGKVNGRVAKPNRSFHEYKLAVDSGELYYKAINNVESTSNQHKLIKYGIFKPLTIGNGIKEKGVEDWHLQPLETLDATLEERRALMPEYIIKSNPYQILKSKNIISKDGFNWETACNENHQIQGIYVKGLFQNYYKYKTKQWSFTFTDVLNYLKNEKIISDMAYWAMNSQPNCKVSGSNVKIVIERMSAKI